MLYVSEFNQWAQELLPAQSGLYEFAPEMIVLLLEPEALFPKAAACQAQTPEEAAAERKTGLSQIAGLLSAAKQNAPAATVVLHTFAVPDYSPLGLLDLKTETGQYASFEAINAELISLVNTQFPKTVLFDQERVEARHGKSRVRDERMWYMASMPFSETFLPAMATEYIRIIRPFKGLTRKCIVLDLDNTLWGGVIGEDGISHIKIGGTAAPGNAFRDFQIALDGLSRRGILLAACSKNNPDDVWPVFESHPHMVLRRSHFAAVRINWQDKATNIREIARDLNIGLDSLVFLDDNPAERGLVRQEVPEVLTVEMPRDPALYTRTLLGLDVFETLSLTKEDQQRSQQYQAQQERQQFEEATSSSGDLTAYLTGLQITAQIAPASVFTLPRIAQLINKTNQFNVTTRRYTEAQVQAMADAPNEWGVYSITVADRFGDSGLTGVAIVKKDTEAWEIDSFLLSCRVLGRGIEAALMTFLVHQAQSTGATHLRGLFIPSPKNEPAAGLFEAQGFEQGESSTDGTLNWVLNLVGYDSQYPAWLTIQEEN